jgi:nitrogen PTS system EIIA component
MMSEPADSLLQQRVVQASGLSNKKKVLVELSEMLAPLSNLSCSLILDALRNRERMGSTSLGVGVAIPHSRMAVDEPKVVVLKLEQAIEYDKDQAPVDIFFAMLVPFDKHEQHLSLLANVANLVKDQDWLQDFRQASNVQQLKSMIMQAAPNLGKYL